MLKLLRNKIAFGIVTTIIVGVIIASIVALVHYYSSPVPLPSEYGEMPMFFLVGFGLFGIPFVVIGLKHHLREKYHAKATVTGKYIDEETTFFRGTDFQIRHRMVTFEIDDDTTWSFGLTKREYRKLQIGDEGTLTYGLRYDEKSDDESKVFKRFKKQSSKERSSEQVSQPLAPPRSQEAVPRQPASSGRSAESAERAAEDVSKYKKSWQIAIGNTDERRAKLKKERPDQYEMLYQSFENEDYLILRCEHYPDFPGVELVHQKGTDFLLVNDVDMKPNGDEILRQHMVPLLSIDLVDLDKPGQITAGIGHLTISAEKVKKFDGIQIDFPKGTPALIAEKIHDIISTAQEGPGIEEQINEIDALWKNNRSE